MMDALAEVEGETGAPGVQLALFDGSDEEAVVAWCRPESERCWECRDPDPFSEGGELRWLRWDEVLGGGTGGPPNKSG